MEEYDFKREEVRTNILTNRHNHITTCYYLLLKSKIKKGIHSVSDLISNEFREYLSDKKNLLINYNHDINLVVEERAISPKSKEKKKKNNNDNDNDIILEKENKRISADLGADMNSNLNFNLGNYAYPLYLYFKMYHKNL